MHWARLVQGLQPLQHPSSQGGLYQGPPRGSQRDRPGPWNLLEDPSKGMDPRGWCKAEQQLRRMGQKKKKMRWLQHRLCPVLPCFICNLKYMQDAHNTKDALAKRCGGPQERVNLQDDDLTRLLHSLCCTKFKLLNKDPDTKTINKGDKFRWAAALSPCFEWASYSCTSRAHQSLPCESCTFTF